MAARLGFSSTLAIRRCKALFEAGRALKPGNILEAVPKGAYLPMTLGTVRGLNAPAEYAYERPLDRPPTYDELLNQIDDVSFRTALDMAVHSKLRQEMRQMEYELVMWQRDLDMMRKEFDQEIFRRDRILENANRQIMIKAGWWNMAGIMKIWSQQNNDSKDWKNMLIHCADLFERIKKRTNWDDETAFFHVDKMFKTIDDPYHEKLQTSPTDVDIIQGPVNREEALALSCIGLHCRVRHRLYLAPPDK